MMSEYNQTIGFFFVNKSHIVSFLDKSNIDGLYAHEVKYFDTLSIVFDSDGRIDRVIYEGDWHSVQRYDVYNKNISMIITKWNEGKPHHLNIYVDNDDNALTLHYEEVAE